MSELLSVIIPVYQNKKYLLECVNSILEQTYKNIEIILVDDGSTDGSSSLCDELRNKYSNIYVKHIKNSGPYIARKEGVNIAHGKLITFVDSDDWIETNAYEKLMNIYKTYKPDIIAFTYKTDLDCKVENSIYKEGLYDHEKIKKEIISSFMYNPSTGERGINPSVCCKIFNKSIYEKVTNGIDEYINWGEDAMVSYPAICVANSVYITNYPYYIYRVNINSEIHSYPLKRFNELSVWGKCLKQTFNNLGFNNEMDFQVDCYMRTFLETLISNICGIHIKGDFFSFPYIHINKGAKIQIYGAGDVGKSYVYELLHSNYAQIVGWYDKDYKNIISYAGIEIHNPEDITKIDSDVILIAINNEQVAKKIKECIEELGVESKKIFWIKPALRR